MPILNFEPLAKTIAINSINGYQQYISPVKGFSCPHRLLHGGDSCSNFVKKILLSEQSLIETVKLSRQRLQNCATASKTLASSNCGFIVIPCCLPL
ncbi:membrane protein insertion efficiency factor YidD [Halotia branconii]|uniref:Membrane protein insertion efficiency factor YidD n=1 Tax=Halotia branconii CENA392 TaxID=1539056 RepID=A0AAJ6P7G3_9CYAN|nr:membrane protein insertion efficiency factor YidD [Halotia branconii]WGV23610.1 membrane protein insertion efficiency factor YidD [Halotia branconii CENA392]